MMKLRERHEGQPDVLKAAEGALRGRSPELRGDWGRSHGLEEAGHVTMADPSHHPLLPPTQAPPWAQGLPGTTAVTSTGLQGLGGDHRLPRTFLQVSSQPLPTARLPLQPHPALGFSGLMLAHNQDCLCLALACPAYLFPCVCLLISISVSMWQIFLPEDAWFCWNKIN